MSERPQLEFTLSPYKLSLALLSTLFIDLKGEMGQREIGRICIVLMKLIHGQELGYTHLRSYLHKSGISKELVQNFEDEIADLISGDVGSLIDLVTMAKNLVQLNIVKDSTSSTNTSNQSTHTGQVNKSSILGFFLRKVYIFFDKLDFARIVCLYESLQLYYKEAHKQEIADSSLLDLRFKFMNPKKQINLIEINEKQALSPPELLKLLWQNSQAGGRPNPTALKNQKATYFLQYLNFLRINEYSAAQDFLYAYFDGQTDQSSRCWAALNQALYRLHFGYYKLALEHVKECISSAQEADDEKCLEFAFLLIAKIILNDKSHRYTDEDILRFLYHLLTKATKLDLHHLSAIAHLQFENLVGLGSDSKVWDKYFDNSNYPDALAVKHSMPEVLMMSYISKSAQYASIGAKHLMILRSQALLHLHLVEHIGEGLVYRVNENTCIAIRNIALHTWRNCGYFTLAKDMITVLAANLFSSYQSKITGIWEQTLAEIQFEHHYLRDEWSKAENFINQIRLYDTTEASLRMVELHLKQKRRNQAFLILSQLENNTSSSDNKITDIDNLPLYTQVRIKILKGHVLNDFETLFEALKTARQNHFVLLEVKCILEVARLEYKFGQKSRSLSLLKGVFLSVLGYATRRDVAFAHYLEALNQRSLGKLESALSANQIAIDICRRIEDKEYSRKAYSLHAQLYNEMKNYEKRNFYALQVRKLLAN